MVIIGFDHKDMKLAIQERVYVKSFDSNSSDFKNSCSYLFHLILFYNYQCLVYKQTSDVHVLGRN